MKTQVCPIEDCTGCGLCSQVCPKNAITMQCNEEGFQYPQIIQDKCVDCDLCSKNCIAITKPLFNNEKSKYYLAWNNDNEGRNTGSSGGLFYALSKQFILDGGVVCGAKFLDAHQLEHVLISNIDEIEPLCGSKYIPSEAYHVFQSVRKALANGQKVLFVGTPCQVDALYHYCGRHELLYTCDLICYGVGSMAVWNAYIDRIETKHQSKCETIHFRKKIYGSRNASMIIRFADGTYERSIFYVSDFGIPFSRKWISRKSCYHCQYAVRERLGDITLGDYTGDDLCQQSFVNIKKGVSLCRSNTKKGEQLLDCSNITKIPKEESFILATASRQSKKAETTEMRDHFMKEFLTNGFDFVERKYCHVSRKMYLLYRFDSYLQIVKRFYRKIKKVDEVK